MSAWDSFIEAVGKMWSDKKIKVSTCLALVGGAFLLSAGIYTFILTNINENHKSEVASLNEQIRTKSEQIKYLEDRGSDSYQKLVQEMKMHFDLIPKLKEEVTKLEAQRREETTKLEALRKAETSPEVQLQIENLAASSKASSDTVAVISELAQDAKQWAIDFTKELPQKQLEIQLLAKEGQSLADRSGVEWAPFYDFIIQEFDGRAEGFKQEGLVEEIKKEDEKLVLVGTSGGTTRNIRIINFKNGNAIVLTLKPASVFMGKLQDFPELIVGYEFKTGINEAAFRIAWTDKGYSFHPANPRYRDLIPSESVLGPISDSFKSKLKEAINKLFDIAITAE